MAANVTVNRRDVPGDKYLVQADVTLPSSYETGGQVLAASDFNLTKFDWLSVASPCVSGYVLSWDKTNKKLMAYVQDAGGALAEVSAAVDLSAVTVPVLVMGA